MATEGKAVELVGSEDNVDESMGDATMLDTIPSTFVVGKTIAMANSSIPGASQRARGKARATSIDEITTTKPFKSRKVDEKWNYIPNAKMHYSEAISHGLAASSFQTSVPGLPASTQQRISQPNLRNDNLQLPLQPAIPSFWSFAHPQPLLGDTTSTAALGLATPSSASSSSSALPTLHSLQPIYNSQFTNNDSLVPPTPYRPQVPSSHPNALDGLNYGQTYHSSYPASNLGNPNNPPSNRRNWMQPSSNQLPLGQHPAYSNILPTHQSTLSDQQRSTSFTPQQPNQYAYTSGGVVGSGNSSSVPYDNTGMSSVNESITDSSSSQGAYDSGQRSQQAMQMASHQYQQQPLNYNYVSGGRNDASHSGAYTMHRLPGQRSDPSDQDSLSASASASASVSSGSDWNSLPNLRLQQLRGAQPDPALIGASSSDQSSSGKGSRKHQHQSRARLQTHLRQLQAEMADLKERVRAAEDLYRETSPIAGSSSATNLPPFEGRAVAQSDDLEMRDSKKELGAIGGGMESLGNAYSTSFPQSFAPSSADARRKQMYSANPTPSRSSTQSSSSSSAMNTVLGRRGTWRSGGEDGKVLIFNASGSGDYEYSSRGSMSQQGGGAQDSIEENEGLRSGEIDDDEAPDDEEEEGGGEGGSSSMGGNIGGVQGEDTGKRYQCLVSGCYKTFTTSGHARRHSRTHLGHKLFVCPHDNCGSTFTRRDNCRQHQRARHRTTLPVYELTETETLEHLILDRQQEEQQRQRQHEQQMHVLQNIGEGSAPSEGAN